MTRVELDGRNNEDTMRRCPWILASDKWNDPHYNPVSMSFNDLHEDFTEQIDLGHSTVSRMGNLTAKKAKEKFMKMKNDLIIVKNNWEKSGNGDGSVRNNAIAELADSDDETEMDLMNANEKCNFLNGKSPATLYLWEVAESHGILASVCNELNSSVMLDSSGDAADIESSGREKRKNAKEKDDANFTHMISGLKETIQETNSEMKSTNVVMISAVAAKNSANATNKENKLMELIQTENRLIYDIEDELDETGVGSRRRERLESRLDALRKRIKDFEDQLQNVRRAAITGREEQN